MKKIVISLGGSIVLSNTINIEFLKRFTQSIEAAPSLEKCGIVVGGGSLARNYIEPMRKAGVNDYYLDRIGIRATRLNAELLMNLVKDAEKQIPESIDEAVQMWKGRKFIVMGGTTPGHTTDTVAMLLAEAEGISEFINGTSVDGVYPMDPRLNPDVKMIEKLSYTEALSLSLESYKNAGSNVFMDPVSLLIARRANIRIHVMNGNIIENYIKVIENKKIVETLIS
ncbi:MAG: UMP kinase [Thermoplasmataceae archaeon]